MTLAWVKLQAGAGAIIVSSPDIPKIQLAYAFSVSIFFQERIRIDSPRGRVFVPAASGEVWGPRLQGRVVPRSGADWASMGLLDAHYQLEAADGSLIYIHNRGFLRPQDGAPPPPAMTTNSGAWLADMPLYFRLTPSFDAPEGPHDWLSRTMIVGTGRRYGDPDHTIFTYYEVL